MMVAKTTGMVCILCLCNDKAISIVILFPLQTTFHRTSYSFCNMKHRVVGNHHASGSNLISLSPLLRSDDCVMNGVFDAPNFVGFSIDYRNIFSVYPSHEMIRCLIDRDLLGQSHYLQTAFSYCLCSLEYSVCSLHLHQ